MHKRNAPLPIEKDGSCPTTPLPSSLVTLFDWSRLAGYDLTSYVPFHITPHDYNMVIHSIVIDEGALVSILSSIAWKALGAPYLVHVTQNILVFNRGTSQPLGILLKFLITLGGKSVYLIVMVVQGS